MIHLYNSVISKDALGHSKLHDIILSNNTSIIDKTLEELEHDGISLEGTDYIHYAIKSGGKRDIEVLINLGAEPHLSDLKSPSLVSLALSSKDNELVNIVIRAGRNWLRKYNNEYVRPLPLDNILKIEHKKEIDKLLSLITISDTSIARISAYANSTHDIELICLIKDTSPREVIPWLIDSKLKRLALELF
jgi:ankyrin repeat protein